MFPKPYDLNNLSVRKYLKKIGEIIILMGFLESWVDFWIWELIGANGNASEKQDIGKKITSGIMYRQKIDLLLTMVQSRSPERITNFKKIHKKLQLIGEKRNLLIHSQWFLMYGNKKEHLRRHTDGVNLRHGHNRADGVLDFSRSFLKLELSGLSRFISNIQKIHLSITKFFND